MERLDGGWLIAWAISLGVMLAIGITQLVYTGIRDKRESKAWEAAEPEREAETHRLIYGIAKGENDGREDSISYR